MKRLFLCFAVAAICTAKGSAQGYSNFDNIGQYTFEILKNLDRLDREQFATYWDKTLELASQLGEEVPEDFTDDMYDRITDSGRQAGIKWREIRFVRFEDMGFQEGDDGLLCRVGMLYVSHEGAVYKIKIKTLLHNGKYYLGQVKFRGL